MPVICPAILAADAEQYQEQIEKVAHFAERIQIDLTDGVFTNHRTVTPAEAWWPVGIKPDFHLMYRQPDTAVQTILEHQPNMVIVHAEAEGNFASFAEICRRRGVKVGIALLQRTSVESVLEGLEMIDHILIFSGELGSYGGRANFDMLNKVDVIKHHKPDVEIGWDGGIDVFNVGGFIQNAADPERAYKILGRIAEETGTT
jgi:ribulose-phosphate 3-epimerase